MARLPRSYEEAARQSIASYEAQIAQVNAILDSDHAGELRIVNTDATGRIYATHDLAEDAIIEALQALIHVKAESIRVLSDALKEEED